MNDELKTHLESTAESRCGTAHLSRRTAALLVSTLSICLVALFGPGSGSGLIRAMELESAAPVEDLHIQVAEDFQAPEHLAPATLSSADFEAPVGAVALDSNVGVAPRAPEQAESAPDAVVGEAGFVTGGIQQTDMTVEMRDNVFAPEVVTVTVGSIVRWRNVGQNPHTTTSERGYWDRVVTPGVTYSARFLSPGTYAYLCRFHRNQGMTGTVVVTGNAPDPLPTQAPPTADGEIAVSDLSGLFQSDIYAVRPDGTGRTNMSQSPSVAEAQPSWAPGRKFFAATQRSAPDVWRIARFDRAAGTSTPLTDGPEDYEPAWSHDGSRILFSRYERTADRITKSGIWLLAPDGSATHPLLEFVDPNWVMGNPRWSPNDQEVVFTVGYNESQITAPDGAEIYVMNADGSNPQRLFPHPGYDDIDPAWSPDGGRIAFAAGRWAGSTQATNHAIWLYDRQTGTLGTIVSHASWDLRGPTWSPDGQWIAFSAQVGTGDWDIYLVSPDGRRVRGPVTSGAEPDWAAGPGVNTPEPTPTNSPEPGTPTVPPFPTFPADTPPPPPPFPTMPPPEPTATGTAPPFPTFPPPTGGATDTPGTAVPTNTPDTAEPTGTLDTPGPSSTPRDEYRIFAPKVYNETRRN